VFRVGYDDPQQTQVHAGYPMFSGVAR
jgi:hypothetical protein